MVIVKWNGQEWKHKLDAKNISEHAARNELYSRMNDKF